MSWVDRVRNKIILTSPRGNKFEAFWISNNRGFEKKLGLFDYPKVRGTLIQDLDIGSTTYPLNIYFEGTDHDLISNRFFESCKEVGVWNVIHPIKGSLTLQLVSMNEVIDPIKSGNITQFETSWLEPLDPYALKSTPQVSQEITEAADELNGEAITQFDKNIIQNTESQISAVKLSTNKVTEAVTKHLKPLYEKVPEINSRVEAILRGVQETLTDTTIDTLSLAGQIIHLIELPGLAAEDITTRLTIYSGMILDIFSQKVSGSSTEDRNNISVQELALTAVIVAISKTPGSNRLKTRNKAIGAIESLTNIFSSITDYLDVTQEQFLEKDIDEQYFSQSQSFMSSSVIVSLSVNYLLLSSFDLAVEKRISLDREKTPIEITISEYGTLGKDDSNFHLFVESNDLVGNEILLLPAGKEVVVYV